MVASAGMKRREIFDLVTKIGTRVDQKPIAIVGGNRQLRLGTRATGETSLAQPRAIRTGTIPLRKRPSRGRSKNSNAHPCLDFRVCVAGNFAAKTHFFELRRGPFHSCKLLAAYSIWSGSR